MPPLEQGMLAFLLATLFFMATTAILFRKLNQAQRRLRQLEEKATHSQFHDSERQYKK